MLIGRTDEVNAWRQVLADPSPSAVVVVGAQGMGKSELLRGMLDATVEHPTLDAGGVLYEVVPSDSFEVVVHQMVEDAYWAGSLPESSTARTSRRQSQWKALVGILPRGDKLYALVKSLRKRPELNPRDVLRQQLETISQQLPDSGRAVFFIDAEKDLNSSHADSWRLVVRDLPRKCKLVFSQRPDGALASNDDFMAGANIVRIPGTSLGVLRSDDVRTLVSRKAAEIGVPGDPLLAAVDRYHCHPFAVTAALKLIRSLEDIDELPADPTPERVSQHQWKAICGHGQGAVRLFYALASLESPAPIDIICEVAPIMREELASLSANAAISQFTTQTEDDHWAIYHSLLSDRIVADAGAALREYHQRAANAYRRRIEQSEAAAVRLPFHCQAIGGNSAFASAVAESLPSLINFGLYNTALEMVDSALVYSKDERTISILTAGTAQIHRRKGELAEAEAKYRKALPSFERLGEKLQEAIAITGLAELAGLKEKRRESEGLWNKAAEIFIATGNSQGSVQSLNAIGSIYLSRNDVERAEGALADALQIADNADDNMARALTMSQLAACARHRGDTTKAIALLEQAQVLFGNVNYQEGVAGTYRSLGAIWQVMGRYDDALSALERSLEIQEMLQHTLQVAHCQEELALTHLAIGNHQEADRLARSAQPVFRTLGLDNNLAKNYSLLAQIHHRNGELRTALFMSEFALKIFEEQGDSAAVSTELCNIGAVQISSRKPAEAILIYQRALKSLGEHGSLEKRAFALYNLGYACCMQGNIAAARQYLSKAKACYQQLGFQPETARTEALLRTLPDDPC